MAPADDKNITPFDQHLIQQDIFIEGFMLPGDSAAGLRAKRFLRRLMEKYPLGLPGRTKLDYSRICCQRFKISGRYFDRIWEQVIAFTNAIAYRTSGPPGPREL
jgi:hypothetical protein